MKRSVDVDISARTEPFWRLMIEEAVVVGPAPIIIVPYSKCGADITAAVLRTSNAPLGEFNVSHVANMPSGGGVGYLGTINGIHVYSARVMINQALLCSSQLIRSIEYDVVHGEGDVVDFSFVDGDDLANSRVRLRFSQNIEWADMPVVKFSFIPLEMSEV